MCSYAMKLHRYMGDYNRCSMFIPNKTVVLVNTKTCEQYQQAMKIAGLDHVIETHYDTSFNFSNYYYSSLLYRNPILERKNGSSRNRSNEPIIPLVTIIHEKRSKDDHELFFAIGNKTVSRIAPLHDIQQKAFISDREFEAKEEHLPGAKNVYCTFYLKKNVMDKCVQLGISKEERKLIKHDFHAMLRSSS